MNKGLDAIDKINIRLQKLEEYLRILVSLRGVTAKELLADVNKRAKAERFFQLAIEVCLDVAELLISDQRLRTPQKAREAIEILGEAGIIDKDFAKEFSAVASFRNILVHDYLDIDYEKVADDLNNHLEDFEKFAKAVANYLK